MELKEKGVLKGLWFWQKTQSTTGVFLLWMAKRSVAAAWTACACNFFCHTPAGIQNLGLMIWDSGSWTWDYNCFNVTLTKLGLTSIIENPFFCFIECWRIIWLSCLSIYHGLASQCVNIWGNIILNVLKVYQNIVTAQLKQTPFKLE